ncbi:MFS transporter [Clostridium kluyveri]|uniref:MFS transporter n=1 Tax=Clostridium kluyveri TaxID=1534 RepID=UPI0022486A7F|nr:MFS transporter [Clostridium kluyveri]UZQ49510.1 MFS transporter [Clostridium kluyveri]
MKKNYKEAPFMKFHLMLYVCTILGQIACGYALGIAGTAVTQAQDKLGLSTFWVGLLGAGTLIGLAGSLVVGNIADKIGRSKLLILGMVLFSVFSILQLFTSSVEILMVLRICIGLCIAVDYTVGSTIISEWFSPKDGPIYLSRFIIFWTFGYVASFFAGLIMGNLSTDYHVIFITSVIPGALAAISRIVIGVPESPAWLATVGRLDEANKLITEKLGDEYCVVVEEKKELNEKVSVMELFSPKYRKNTLVGGAFWACQVFPYFGVGIFLPILISKLNMGNANTSSILYDVFCMAGAFIGTYLCNRISRKRFLVSTFYIAAIALGVMIVGHNGPTIIMVTSFCVYALVMSIAVVIENPYPPELFDDRVRGTGVGIVIAFSRLGAAAGTFLLPILVKGVGVYGTLGVCFAILLIGGVVCHLFAPETSVKHIHLVDTDKRLSTS